LEINALYPRRRHLSAKVRAFIDRAAYRYAGRMSEDYLKLTGNTPTSMADFVKLHAAEFTRL
jgi:hypothetical protein